MLQAVRRFRRCGIAGGERVSPAQLGWYLCTYPDKAVLTVTTHILWENIKQGRSACLCLLSLRIQKNDKIFLTDKSHSFYLPILILLSTDYQEILLQIFFS